MWILIKILFFFLVKLLRRLKGKKYVSIELALFINGKWLHSYSLLSISTAIAASRQAGCWPDHQQRFWDKCLAQQHLCGQEEVGMDKKFPLHPLKIYTYRSTHFLISNYYITCNWIKKLLGGARTVSHLYSEMYNNKVCFSFSALLSLCVPVAL